MIKEADYLDAMIAAAERLLDSTLLDQDEREYLEAALAYDLEVRDRLRKQEAAQWN